MKIGLMSDVHADPLSLQLAWSHLTVMGAERVLCAGDLVGYGPQPDRAVAFVNAKKIEAIRGNHDRWALARPAGRPDDFGGAGASSATIALLSALPTERFIQVGEKKLAMYHGSPRSDMEYVLLKTHGPEALDALLDEAGADVLVVGHTHAPMWYRGPRGLVINPGSVISMPVVRTSRTFALLDLDAMTVTFHDVESARELKVPHWA